MAILDTLHQYNLRAFANLEPPALAEPVVVGTPGTTTYTYKATIITIDGETTAGEAMACTTGYATLDADHKILLAVARVPAGARYIKFFKDTSGTFKYLGTCTVEVNAYYDIGTAVTSEVPVTENTSGRNEWKFALIHNSRPIQRMDFMDMQAMAHKALQDIADTIHRNGDVISGMQGARTYPTWITLTVYAEGTYVVNTVDYVTAEYICNTAHTADVFATDLEDGKWTLVPGAHWSYKAGVLYVDGLHISVPAGDVVLTETDLEKVGVLLTPDIITYLDDIKLRNIDDNIPLEYYNVPGNDRLVIIPTWSVDDDDQVTIQEYIDGTPKSLIVPPERTELDIAAARRTYDVSGSFVVEPFPLKVFEHETDDTKLNLNIGIGCAYPNGFERRRTFAQNIPFNKARVVKAQNNSSTGVFNIPGGYTISTNHTTFNVNGLNMKLKVGSGDPHTITLTGTTETATTLKTQIEAIMNAIPTDGDLVICTAASGYLEIQAVGNKTLEIQSVASDAYTIIGLTVGVYYPIGTRVYEINDNYVKTVSDLNYKTEVVSQVTHNGTTHKDLLPFENVVEILGASATLAPCHDGVWTYENEVDFERDGNYISFAGMAGAEPGNGATYYVKYSYRLTAEKGIRELVRVIDAKVTKGAEDGEDMFAFTDATAITKVLNGSAVTGLSGNPIDVVRILTVNTTPGSGTSYYTTPVLQKNSGSLLYEESTIDWAAAGAPGSGVGGQPATNDIYYVSFEFWNHSTEGDYVSADSYDMYEEIEFAPNGEWLLRDCIDFRTDGIMPSDDEDVTLDYEFYLPRTDKLMMDESGGFRLVEGTPSVNRPIPPDQPKVLSIAIIYIQPYTYNEYGATIVSVEPMRTTQVGINNLAHRIERLEYWNSVNMLEKEAQGHPVAADAPGLFTDALTGWSRMDLAFDKGGITHTAALDRYTRTLLLPAITDPQTLDLSIGECVGIYIPLRADGTEEDTLMLEYEPAMIQEQPWASRWINCASDYVYENYYGLMDISPSTDVFMDTNQLPQLNADFEGNLGAIYDALNPVMANNINWGSWNTVSTVFDFANTHGIPTQNPGMAGIYSSTDVLTQQERSGTYEQILPGSKTVDMGDRVVDLSLVPMVRTTNADNSPFVIQISIVGLMPNIDHACTFGGVVVDLTYDSAPVNHHGSVGNATYQSKTTAKTSNDGNLTAKFTVPSGVAVGSIPITVFYYADPDISTSTTVFYSRGFQQNTQKTTVGVPDPKVQVLPAIDSQILQTELITVIDPLAETYTISKERTYVSAIGVYFKSKHATLPITTQIRNVVNGFPGPFLHASTTLFPANVYVSDDSSLETIFTFAHVVGYEPDNDYCFVLLPSGNNTGYEIFYSELGDIDFLTARRITTQPPGGGVMFHSPNNSVWEPMTKSDIKHRIYKSNFRDNCSIVFSNLTGVDASRFVVAVEEFLTAGTHSVWSYSLDNGTTWIAYNPRIDVDLEAIITQIKLKIDVTATGGNYQIMWNVAGIILICHELTADCIFNNQYFTDPLEYPTKVTCYMDLDADGTNGGGETFVTPYFSVDDGVTWIELEPKVGYTPTISTDPYYRYEFESEVITEFSQMRPRLYFETTNKARTPRVMNPVFICSKE
jgi:hypothetical protein